MAATVNVVQQTQQQQEKQQKKQQQQHQQNHHINDYSQNFENEHRQCLFQFENNFKRERCVLVTRKHDGFGLTISGNHPIYVDSVKIDGAAFKAGVRKGDQVIKVNGMPVTNSNFQEVLQMISGGHNLALTLLSKSLQKTQLPISYLPSIYDRNDLFCQYLTEQINSDKNFFLPLNYSNNNSNNQILQKMQNNNCYKRESILSNNNNMTEPIFSTFENSQIQQNEWKRQRIIELFQMLKHEQKHLETLRKAENSYSLKSERLEKALQRINDLQFQLKNINLSIDANSIYSSDSTFQSSKNTATLLAPPNLAGGSVFSVQSTISSKIEPVKSWVESGGMNYVQGVNEFDSMIESNEEENDMEEGTGPFSNLLDLKTRSAHLAVFLSYLLNSSNPNSLLFYLITDSYQASSNTKELRRFAYEIFSTFVIPNAPLQVPDINQSLIQQIDKILCAVGSNNGGVSLANISTSQDIEKMKKIFIQVRTLTIGDINERLAHFRRKRALGGKTGIDGLGIDINQLNHIAKADYLASIKIAEQILFRHLETLITQAGGNILSTNFDSEIYDSKTLALISSIATIIKNVIGLKTTYSPWEKLLEKCPTFVTSLKSSMLSKMKPKKTIQIKDHQFSLNSICLTIYCYQCREVIWGINPQAYFCQYCDVIVHKQCTIQLIDHCYPVASQQKTLKTGINIVNTGKILTNVSRTLRDCDKNSNNNISPYNKSLDAFNTSKLNATADQRFKKEKHSSLSLTPPLSRSHASTATIIGSIIGAQNESPQYHLKCDIDDSRQINENELNSNVITKKNNQLPPPILPLNSENAIPQIQQGLSTNILQQQIGFNLQVADNIQSMSSDSGIGTDLINGVDNKGISRAQSMKVETNIQGNHIRRNGRGANSLGATDFTVTTPMANNVISPLATTNISEKKILSNYNEENLLSNSNSSSHIVSSKSEAVSMQSLSDSTIKAGVFQASGLVVAPQCITVSPSLNRLSDNNLISIKSIGLKSENDPNFTDEAQQKLYEKIEQLTISDNDSDLEVETEVPSLESILSWEVLRHLKPKEKKRQDVINELFHTERTHVRNLKILYKIFYRPLVMQKIVSLELIHLLFGNLIDLLMVHQEIYKKMQQALLIWKQQFVAGTLNICNLNDCPNDTGGLASINVNLLNLNPPYGNIGELIESIFDGETGERLMRETSLFCQNQQHALDTLRQKYNRNKDDPFSQFLIEAESNILCRKLQLKDMIPVEMQRLVKYPLLLETIAKYTQDPSEELTRLLYGINCAKKILSAVNTAKRNAENQKRLEEIQKKIEITDKTTSFFQKFDFRNHHLIYEGPLQWRQSRNKTIDLHVVLLDHLIVFLTKVGTSNDTSIANQKWQLKVHEVGCIPIMKLSFVEVEEKISDKRAFNLLYTCDLRLFELVAPTATERKTWHRLIENQVIVSKKNLSVTENEVIDFLNSSNLPNVENEKIKINELINDDSLALNAKSMVVELEQSRAAEQVHVITHPNFATANEIIVEQPCILKHAKQMQTPMERLSNHDTTIINALVDKHNILSELLKEKNEGNKTDEKELEKIVELMSGLSVGELKQRSSRELAMSAIVHGNRLLDCINQGMGVNITNKDDESKIILNHLPSVPCYKLTAVAAPLMNHLKALMQVIQNQEQQIAIFKQQNPETLLNNDQKIINTQSISSNNKPQFVSFEEKRLENNIAYLIGNDDSTPPPLPPSSTPPLLD